MKINKKGDKTTDNTRRNILTIGFVKKPTVAIHRENAAMTPKIRYPRNCPLLCLNSSAKQEAVAIKLKTISSIKINMLEWGSTPRKIEKA